MRAMIAEAVLASFLLSLAALLILLSRLGSRIALDRPNERSLHERPVPRTGGIAVLAGAAVSLALGAEALWLTALLAAALAVVSLLDDLFGMPTLVRFAAHLAAAGLFVWYTLSPMHPATLVLLALAVAWITNLYNFMDGADGIAAGMALIGFGAYALGAALAGDTALATLCAALAAASAAFLQQNFHPARIFLGDVGSIPLGFLAAALGLVGWRDDAWPLWFPLLVFGPFIGDATVTLLKRLLRRERVWQAHRAHYYQRMVRMGFGHRGTAYLGYLVMLGCAAAALWAREQTIALQAMAFAGTSLVLGALALWVDARWARFERQSGSGA